MKQIQILVSNKVRVSTTGTNITRAMALTGEARQNKAKVLEGALTVEHELVQIISYYFFGSAHDRKTAFESLILNSDFSFNAKRRLISHIISERQLLQGSEREAFDKLLRDVMSFRNAFAHGTFSSDDNAVWISYFEGTPQKKEMTDEFLTDVETTLRSAWEQCVGLAQKMGVTKDLGTNEMA